MKFIANKKIKYLIINYFRRHIDLKKGEMWHSKYTLLHTITHCHTTNKSVGVQHSNITHAFIFIDLHSLSGCHMALQEQQNEKNRKKKIKEINDKKVTIKE